ncbi:MAG TPA: cob(I)yrinic acid a,c-diamide adenosyltransferase, partial [Devosiaceae bacterium]|nr:cob(I)yrinic acid a,c-diamide adenosyltransferase [Devosiaceae bacterium]
SRRKKNDSRVEAFGTVDEANSCVGLARVHTTGMPKVDTVLARIQNDLFDLGSDLATPGGDPDPARPSLRITASQIDWLEKQIDHYNESLQPLTSFVLPGGSPLAANLHLARTVARRAERLVVALAEKEADTNPEAQKYLNRLSDLLFVLARIGNANGTKDVLWTPGRFAGEGN